MKNLTKHVKTVRVMNAVAAGQTNQTSSAVAMADFESCRFIVLFGTIDPTATPQIKVQQATTSGGSYSDLAGTEFELTATDDNKMAIVEVHRPMEPFLKCVVVRDAVAADSTIDGVIAELHGAKELPVVADATALGNEVHVSPAEGTA